MGSNRYWAGRVYDLCINFMTGTPEGSTEIGFMEKTGCTGIHRVTRDFVSVRLFRIRTVNELIKGQDYLGPGGIEI